MATAGFGGFDDDFPLDQFADLSTFSSPAVISSFSSPVVEKEASKTEAVKVVTPIVAVTKEVPSPLVQQLASVLVARLYGVALELRDEIDNRLMKNSLHARNELPAFVTMISKHVELTLLQALYKLADERKTDLALLWTQYNAFRRPKSKENMSKRQFLVLMTHWLTVLAALENLAVNRNYETLETKDTAETGEGTAGRGSKALFGLSLGGKSRDSKSHSSSLLSDPAILQELHLMCLFGASTLIQHVELVVDAAWERLYVHDVAVGLNPRGDPNAPEGCREKFILNFFASLVDLRYRFGVKVERCSKIPALEQYYETKLKGKLAADRQRIYKEHLARSGMI